MFPSTEMKRGHPWPRVSPARVGHVPAAHFSPCISFHVVFYKLCMKFLWTTERQRGPVSAVAALMLLLWLGTFALAALPQLHSLLHKDAQALHHTCLIHQLQQHSLL